LRDRAVAVAFFALTVVLTCECGNDPSAAAANRDVDLAETLSLIGLTEADLTIPTGGPGDPYRFDLTRSLLRDPTMMIPVMERAATHLKGTTGEAALAYASGLLGSDHGLGGSAERVFDGVERVDGGTIDPFLRNHLNHLLASVVEADGIVVKVMGAVPEERRDRIDVLTRLVMRDVALTEPERDSLLAAGSDVDVASLARAAQRLMASVTMAGSRLLNLDLDRWPDSPVRLRTAIGEVVVGSPGDDSYDAGALLFVDPGGSDTYVGCAAVADSLRISICLDLRGDDRYTETHARANSGVAILLDVSGDDVYVGGDRVQGSAAAGIAVLVDGKGDDSYRSEVAAQGFGLFGVGVLCDRDGDDSYSGDLLVQGVGAPRGVGILADGGGGDRYEAGGRYRDFREPPSYQSMAQGFGFGVRTSASGGVGMLYDAGGDDAYQAETFAQGSAHWGGTGLLVDSSGNDTYIAHRFAQGCGSHLSAGGLLDVSGDDRYRLWGVGQGCGHDLSVGILADRAGDDTYDAFQLAQGAARSNGIGILDDGEGGDTYIGREADTQGYGHPARHYGSIGVLIDRPGGGDDWFRGPGAAGMVWTGGTYGVGVDLPGTMPMSGTTGLERDR